MTSGPRSPQRRMGIVAFAAVALVVAGLLGFGISYAVRQRGSPTAAPSPTPLPRAVAALTQRPTVVAAAASPASESAMTGSTTGQESTQSKAQAQTPPVPVPSAVAAALRRGLRAPQLGRRLLAHVIDAVTGRVLFDASGATPAAPASTGKLMTAAAVLATHGPGVRFATTVVRGAAAGTVVIVGGGDPTLSAARPGTAPLYPGAARLSNLARQVKAAGLAVRRIVVDDSLFSGPRIAPSWDRSDMGTEYGAPITPLMVDGGRAAPHDYGRSLTPDLAAGHEFAKALGKPGLPVSRGTAPAHARVLGTVESAPLIELLEEMLQQSDNVIADVLARQVALAEHQPASFTGAVTAIRTVLGELGVNVGTGMRDGSGLSSADRVSPVALTQVLRLIAGYGAAAPAAPGASSSAQASTSTATASGSGAAASSVSRTTSSALVRPSATELPDIVTALPVAGWSGTLESRYVSGPAAAAAGLVRAKTGTLSSVASLAGLVYDRSGRLLIFSFDADRAGSTYDADRAMDVLAARLQGCGCTS